MRLRVAVVVAVGGRSTYTMTFLLTLLLRRRREVGQLSKGAIRAQRAQARAKQMRQNLLGSNLLNMSMYNAQNQYQRQGVVPHHPGAHYAMAESYVPMGYDLDGVPVLAQGYPGQEGLYPRADGEMYRLPPINDAMMQAGYDAMGWHGNGMENWNEGDGPGQYQPHPTQHEYHSRGPGEGYDISGTLPGIEYRLPPLLDMPRDDGLAEHTVDMVSGRREDEGVDPRTRNWARDGLQTPSGHVLFNERLFDGALEGADLQQDRRDEGLAGYNEAIALENEAPPW